MPTVGPLPLSHAHHAPDATPASIASAAPGHGRETLGLVQAVVGGTAQQIGVVVGERERELRRTADVVDRVGAATASGSVRRDALVEVVTSGTQATNEAADNTGPRRNGTARRIDERHDAAVQRCSDVVAVPFEFGRHRQDLDRIASSIGRPPWATARAAAPTRTAPLNPRPRAIGMLHRIHIGPVSAEAIERGTARMMLVELLGTVGRVAHADIGIEIDRHAEHVETGTQVRRRRRRSNDRLGHPATCACDTRTKSASVCDARPSSIAAAASASPAARSSA